MCVPYHYQHCYHHCGCHNWHRCTCWPVQPIWTQPVPVVVMPVQPYSVIHRDRSTIHALAGK